MSTELFVDVTTATYADQLRAEGVAILLRTLLAVLGKRSHVTMTLKNGVYHITTTATITDADIDGISPFITGKGLPLGSQKQQEKATKGGNDLGQFFDYDGHMQQRNAWWTSVKSMEKDRARQQRYRANPYAAEFEGLAKPAPPDLSIYTAINHFKAASNYNDALARWLVSDEDMFRSTIRLLFVTFGQTPNIPYSTKEEVTLVQVVNPSSLKGVNSVKADGLRTTNMSGHWIDEYLKFVGFFELATSIIVGSNKDRKTFVLRPRSIDMQSLSAIMDEFRASFSGGSSLKADIMAALQFTRTFIDYIGKSLHQPDLDDVLFQTRKPQGFTVTDIADGFDVAFSMNMGNAFATMNLATINFPDWLNPITTEAEADETRKTLQEHVDVIRSLRTRKGEEQSDEIALLQRYRDFLSGRDPQTFFDFAAHFGGYSLRHMAENLYVARFTLQGMETLITMTDAKGTVKLTPIITASGFKEVATAIRRSTVIAQRLAAARNGYPYEVRYGLGQELLRAAMYPETFLAALSEFIQSYNAESARIDERIMKGNLAALPVNRRSRITTSAIDDIVRILDEYADYPGVVCKVLVAYGYARDTFVKDDPELPKDAHVDTDEENTDTQTEDSEN